MPVSEVELRVSGREVSEWLAYDQIQAEEIAAIPVPSMPSPQGRGRTPASSAPGSQWIDLTDPDFFEKAKRRMGMI